MITVNDLENYTPGGTTTITLGNPYKIAPRDYLNFASEDLKEKKDKRSLVNALSNAKRSLHFQIDLLTKAFGISNLAPKKRLDFPRKLEFCVQCGIVGPQILRKMNQLRNTVEHEYYVPELDEVKDFIDITELFIVATDHILKNFPNDIEFRSPEIDLFGIPRRGIGIIIKPYDGKITIHINDFITEPKPRLDNAENIYEEYKEISNGLKEGVQLPDMSDEERIKYYRAISRKVISNKLEFSVNDGKDYFEWVSFVLNKRY
ncbi:MAG TPA: hypothetical protein ENN18_06710 [Proteobacteria bacterium]|nr:hypothetical protein [Pseudomonadota bacterium]